MSKVNYDDYMALVGAKINEAKDSLMANGTRDARGFMETAARIRNSASNFYFSQGAEVNDPVKATFNYFSETVGMNDVTNVAAVDLVDLNIMATQQSIMSYLIPERSMEKPVDTAWYQGLVAMNAAGGYEEGDNVFNPFSPINAKKLNLGETTVTKVADLSTADSDDLVSYVIDTKKPLQKGGVVVVAKKGTEIVATGTDLTFKRNTISTDKTGVIYWDNGTACDSATVEYSTGKVTLKGVAASTVVDKIEVTGNIEKTGEVDGSSTLKLKPKTMTVTLKARTNRVILESNYEDNMYLNKQAYGLSSIGVQLDYSKRAISQLLKTFVYFLDTTAVKVVYDAAKTQSESDMLDYTDYLLTSSYADTKNDIVNQYMLKLNDSLLTKTGFGATSYLVDINAARILGNNPLYFSSNETFTKNLDGMIGTYHGVPVIRHQYLNGIADTANQKYGIVIAVYKSPDGQAGCGLYGEYIPPYSISPALNYQNPSQYSQAILSQSTTEVLVPELCSSMKILMAKSE